MNTILVVDDDPNLLRLVQQILIREGYEVSGVNNGKEAIARLESEQPDLMLSDFRLSDMDAEQLIETLEEKSILPPFIIFTGRGDESTAVKIMKRGARDYLMKDSAFLELLPSVISQTLDQIGKEKKLAETEEKLQQAFADLKGSRDDILSILNSMRIGTAMTDEGGRWTFLSDLCLHHFGFKAGEGIGREWDMACPLQEPDKEKIRAMFALPEEKREKISVSLEIPDGVSSWIDVELKDDPRDSRGKIFFFYDMSEVHNLRRMLDEKAQYEDLLGKGKAMQLIFQRIREVANVDSTVLIEGETGTGKEMVAKAIHSTGHRKKGPFIAVNCAGLSDSLLESQLFGHKRGAFTGAIENHKGFFESADAGTLFLDEVGDIPLNVQTRLLRVLQEREITRLGESTPRKIDVRVLVATQHDLEKEVESGRFRRDLFYRVRVARIELPSLGKRREDIPLLARSFLRQCTSAIGKDIQEISPEAMRSLTAHHWLGNVRELQNAIEFAVIRCQSTQIHVGDLPPEVFQSPAPPVASDPAVPMGDREKILDALQKTGGNRSRAAQILGVSRATFYRHMTKLGIPSRDSP